MATLTFYLPSQDDEREVEGEIIQENPVVLEERHQARPNWRIDGDEITLISTKSNNEIEGFAEFVELER